ncbi:hypothetical protein OG21DRAFT_1192591 [Imleria badia]|nr:hypothetical protein OG21DRAFT_1192591 [Imleria badia]
MNRTDGRVPRRSVFGTLFSRTLPAYSGRYPVGVRDVELPVPPQTFGTFKHRSMPDGQVGITLDTIMFTLFYPTEPTTARNAPVPWFPRLVQTVNGLLKMANWSSNLVYKIILYVIVAVITWGTTFPGLRNAPLKVPPGSTKWRVILFSHGAGCPRLMNSTVCGELTSRGYVVAAIEHRDGTGPSVLVTNERGETKDLDWLNWIDLEWTDTEEQPMDDTILRRVQLGVRLAEVEGVLQALQRLTQGQGLVSTGPTPSLCEWEGWHAMELTKPIIAGHSFGGSLAVGVWLTLGRARNYDVACQMAAAADRRFDFSHVITFDPAMHRLDPWGKTISIPLLAINSEEYATGGEFTKLLAIAPCAETHAIYVIPGATHPSFSDVFLILPDHVNKWIGLAADPWHIVHRTIDTTSRFLEDKETKAHCTVKCVDGQFPKEEDIRIGSLVRCHVDDMFDR